MTAASATPGAPAVARPPAPEAAPSVAPAVELEGVEFAYGPRSPAALRVDRLAVARGERLFLRGPSGCGKSTLLGVVGGVLPPRRGAVRVLGQDLYSLRASRRDALRAAHVGYIFQLLNLLPYLSVLENVALPCRLSPLRRERAARHPGGPRGAALELLGRLGMDASLADRPAASLSVGQSQRVAAARALIGEPELVIADEPTSALDAEHRDRFLDLLFAEAARAGATLIYVSHDPAMGGRFDRVLEVSELSANPAATAAAPA